MTVIVVYYKCLVKSYIVYLCKHLIHISNSIKQHHFENDAAISAEGLKEICKRFKEIYVEEVHKPFPQEPLKQLEEAIEAVFKSWDNDRARIYRDLNDIPHDIGTAVNIQEMVFGNSGDNSGTGVAFTRNPVTGENKLFGEYLLNAQGEDVVAGIRTPKDISTLHDQMPEVHQAFVDVTKQLENTIKICKILNLQLKMDNYIYSKLVMVNVQHVQLFKLL